MAKINRSTNTASEVLSHMTASQVDVRPVNEADWDRMQASEELTAHQDSEEALEARAAEEIEAAAPTARPRFQSRPLQTSVTAALGWYVNDDQIRLKAPRENKGPQGGMFLSSMVKGASQTLWFKEPKMAWAAYNLALARMDELADNRKNSSEYKVYVTGNMVQNSYETTSKETGEVKVHNRVLLAVERVLPAFIPQEG